MSVPHRYRSVRYIVPIRRQVLHRYRSMRYMFLLEKLVLHMS
jgi:hypothetical protein